MAEEKVEHHSPKVSAGTDSNPQDDYREYVPSPPYWATHQAVTPHPTSTPEWLDGDDPDCCT